jgi:hypothetical protein
MLFRPALGNPHENPCQLHGHQACRPTIRNGSAGAACGSKLVSHDRYVAFQMAEVAVTRRLFAEILRLIAELRPPPDLAPA